MIYFIIFLIILLYIFVNINFNKNLKLYVSKIFKDLDIQNNNKKKTNNKQNNTDEKFQNTEEILENNIEEDLEEDIEEDMEEENINNISEEEMKNILKYGFLPHNYNENTNLNIESKITDIEKLKETESKNISNYLIYNRLNEVNKINEKVFENLYNSDEITNNAYNILINNNARVNYLNNIENIPYKNMINKDKILLYSEEEFKFLLKSLKINDLITNKALKILLNSKIFKNMKIYDTLQKMYIDENQKFIINNEVIPKKFEEKSLYALNYNSSPHFNQNLYKLQSDKFPTHRRFIPPDWKCQRGDITRVNNRKVVESYLYECHSHIPFYDEFNYYKYLDELE